MPKALCQKMVVEVLGYKAAPLTRWEKRTEKIGFVIVRIGEDLYRVERLEGQAAA